MSNKLFHGRGVGDHGLMLLSLLVLIALTVFNYFIRYSTVIMVPLWFLCFLYGLQSRTVLQKNEKQFVITSFIFFAVVFFYRFIGYSSIDTLGLIVQFNWIMTGVVSIYVLRILSGSELSTVYKVITLSLLILLLMLVSQGGNILATGDSYDAVQVAVAWQGSLFMLLSGLCLVIFLNVKSVFLRIAVIVVLVITLYINIFILQRGTNVIMTIAELGMILFFLIKRKSIVIVLSVIVVAFLVFAFSSDNLIAIFDWLARTSPSDRLSVRFNDISMALQYENLDAATGSFHTRNELIRISWNTFTSSFGHILFGAGEHAGDNTIIGHHSFFTDTLACYGLLGGVLVFIYFKKQYQIVMSYLDYKGEWALYNQFAIVFLFYVLRNFYGGVSYSLVNIVIMIFFPLTFQLIHYYSKDKSKSI